MIIIKINVKQIIQSGKRRKANKIDRNNKRRSRRKK